MHAGILHLDWREKANSNSIDNTHTHILNNKTIFSSAPSRFSRSDNINRRNGRKIPETIVDKQGIEGAH